MKSLARTLTTLGLALSTLPLAAQEKKEPQQVDMAAAMAQAKKYTTPGENHKFLERFIGTWDTETRLTMMPSNTPPEKGTATFRWLMEGRWMQMEASGSMMGMPLRTAYLMGYDNFKMSFVSVAINSFDTAMFEAEGDLDPSGKVLISYGTLDEYLTGEHDKMVKSVWRFLSPDEMIHEVHDLPIGETNTKVFEVRYKRRPQP